MISLLSSILVSSAIAAPPEIGIALRQGNCSVASEYTPNDSEWNYQLAIGKCLVQLGQIDKADAMLQRVPAPFDTYAKLYRAQSAALIGNHTKALSLSKDVLESKSVSNSIQNSARLLQAKAYISQGEYIKGRDALRPLLSPQNSVDGYIPAPGEVDPAEVRWYLAEGARLRGNPEAALPVYWNIWTSNPTSTFAQRAEEQIIAMGHRIPDSTTEEGRQQMVNRANTLRKLQLHKEALAILDLLPVPETEIEKRTYAYYVFSAKEYPRAVTALSDLTEKTDNDLYHLAVSSVRSGDYDACSRYYQQLLEEYPKSKWADISSYKLGYLEYDRGNLEKAIPLFAQHLERFPKSKHADEARYFSGWSLLKLGKLTEAKQWFTEVQTKHFSSSLAAGAAFWHAYILDEEGDKSGAQKGFTYVLKTWPTSGYAWQASHFVSVNFPIVPHVSLNNPKYQALPSSLNNVTFQQGRALAEVGFEALAQERLLSLQTTVEGDRQATLLLAHALIEAGDYQTAQKLARSFCVKPWQNGDPLAQQACYPKPHKEIIDSVLGDHKLDPQLSYAIMTAESALQPTVSSPVGARGMMQLMPYVAEEIHPLLFPNQPFETDTLFQSGYNVSLGTRELMKLYDNMQDLPLSDKLPLVIAGYNGGEEAVRRWMSAYDTTPSIAAFSDDIGYSETRRYNRRVLGYLMTYRYVYGDSTVDE